MICSWKAVFAPRTSLYSFIAKRKAETEMQGPSCWGAWATPSLPCWWTSCSGFTRGKKPSSLSDVRKITNIGGDIFSKGVLFCRLCGAMIDVEQTLLMYVSLCRMIRKSNVSTPKFPTALCSSNHIWLTVLEIFNGKAWSSYHTAFNGASVANGNKWLFLSELGS